MNTASAMDIPFVYARKRMNTATTMSVVQSTVLYTASFTLLDDRLPALRVHVHQDHGELVGGGCARGDAEETIDDGDLR